MGDKPEHHSDTSPIDKASPNNSDKYSHGIFSLDSAIRRTETGEVTPILFDELKRSLVGGAATTDPQGVGDMSF